MLSFTAFSILTTLLATCAGIDCSVKELQPYNFESIKGVHSLTTVKKTPPSQTNITWNIGICEPINSISDCPKNSDLCGIKSIILDDKPIIAEIVSFNANLQKTYKSFSKDDKNSDSDGITISYSGVNWGDSLVDAELKFICDKNAEDNKFKLDKWDGNKLKLTMMTKAACITSDKDKKKTPKPDEGKKKPDNGESWGWFTWIFIFLVLFLSIYIVGGAWFQYNKGNAIDFQSALKEVLENFIDLLRGLPSFCREIIERFTGNRSRGDYSAV